MASETITRNDLQAILNEVLPSAATDYIVEQGTSGIWTYRKWNSGIAECWGAKAISVSSWATWGTWYYISATGDAYPTNLFTTVYSVQGSISSGAGDTISSIADRPSNLSVTAPKITAVRPSAGSTSTNGYAFWHTIGRWK